MLTKDLVFIGMSLLAVASASYSQYATFLLSNAKKALSASVSKNVELITELEKERSKSEIPKISLGYLKRPSESDWSEIASNPELLDKVITVLTYETARRTDAIRDERDSEKIQYRAGAATASHEILFYFYKAKIESQKKEPKNEEAE